MFCSRLHWVSSVRRSLWAKGRLRRLAKARLPRHDRDLECKPRRTPENRKCWPSARIRLRPVGRLQAAPPAELPAQEHQGRVERQVRPQAQVAQRMPVPGTTW